MRKGANCVSFLKNGQIQRYNRMQKWLGLDPHPPIYFRVVRLEKLSPQRIKHPLIQSIKDVTEGFIATLKS
jgi:hypothetical protein